MQTRKQTIYVDMDDVLCETCRGFLDLLEQEFGRRVNYAEVTDFDLGRSFSMTAAEIERFMTRAHEPDILATFAPLPGAADTLAAWSDQGYRIAVLTGRPPGTRAATVDWLVRHAVVHDSLHFVDKYGRLAEDVAAGRALTLDDLAGRRFSLAVEDSGATAAFLAANQVAPVALLDRPWNRSHGGAGIRRISGWEELARLGPRFLEEA